MRGDFLTATGKAANWRICYLRSCLHRDWCERTGHFGRSVSGPRNSVSWEIEASWRRISRLKRGQTEHAALARPFGREFAKTRDAHSVGQAAFDGRLDQVGCEKGKRDRHVDVADAAAFSQGDRFNGDRWFGLKLIQPPSSFSNGSNKECTVL